MALGTLLLLFAAAYVPAFLTVALLKIRPFEAVPAIIMISLAVAILLIKVVSGKAGGLAKFGFRFCHYRYIAAAIVFGAPIAWALTILVNRLSRTFISSVDDVPLFRRRCRNSGGSNLSRPPADHPGSAVS